MTTDTSICFSPNPPGDYTRNGTGHGLWCKSTEEWNLVWLSFPALDLYIETNFGIVPIIGNIDSKLFGSVMALASPALEDELTGLRRALGKGPDAFLAISHGFPWEELAVYEYLGEPWVTTMRQRASYAADSLKAAQCAEAIIKKVIGNVVHAEFGKRRSK